MEAVIEKKTFKQKLKDFWNNKIVRPVKDKNSLFYYVLVLCLFGFAFFFYTIFANGFTAPASGDYVYQSIPFFYNGYDDWWHFLTTGEFPFWDSNLALGGDNLANNSFYYVMDPLFLPVLLFPRSMMPQAMCLLMMVKMILGAVFFRKLLKYMGVNECMARFFSICYGFGGWIIFYSWFAGFMETITFFPLVILGIEKVLKKEKPFTLIIGLFLMGLSNFYFLVPTCIGCVFYAMFRFFQTIKTRKAYESFIALGVGVSAFVIGLGTAAFLTLPSFMNVLTYSRASGSYLGELMEAFKLEDKSTFFGLIFSWDKVDSTGYGFRVAYPLMSFLFPVTDGRSVPIMNFSGNRYDQVASSLFCYTPCIIIFFASLIKSGKEKKFSHFIPVIGLVAMLFIPFFYYMFFAFTSAYGRWEYIPATFLIMYCAISFNKKDEYKKWMFDISFAISIVLMIVAVYLANLYSYVYPGRVEPIGNRWPVIIVQFIYIAILWILFRFHYLKKYFTKAGFIFLLAETALMGGYFAAFHSYTNYYSVNYLNGKDNLAKETEIFKHLNDNDKEFFRVQSSRIVNSGTNIAMAENYNGTSYFHSEYNSNLDQFLHWSRIMTSYGNWTGNAIEKRPLLDTFLGVKYYFTTQTDTNYRVISDLSKPNESSKVYHFDPNIPFGYELVQDGYNYGPYELYENKNHIEIGFSFDKVIDPHIDYDSEDDPMQLNSDFFTYKYMHQNPEALINDYNFMSAAILEPKDIQELRTTYGDEFDEDITQVDRMEWDSLVTKRNNRDFSKTVYRLPAYFDPTKPLDYINIGDDSDQSSVLNPYTDIVVYEPLKSDLFNSEDGMMDALFFVSRINKSHKYNIFLINDEGETVCYDNFLQMDNYYKVFRTMYLNENISKIIMTPMANSSEYKLYKSSLPDYYYTISYDDYMEIINEQKQYELYDTYHSYNTYRFKTNYDQRRLIVLQVPYDKGWSCTVTDANGNKKDLKVYKSTGGFNCVMSELGEVTYEFNFVSYYFVPGALISAASFGSMVIMGVYYHFKKKKQNEKPKGKRYIVVRSK